MADSGFAFYLGVGFLILGVLYTLVVLLMRDAAFGGERRPYVFNGVALCILGISMIARDLGWLPRWAVYLLWAVAGYLAVRANIIIRSHRWPR